MKNIGNFPFQYVKIVFVPKKEAVRENIKIYELQFISKNLTYLVDTK
jgi:hypothetical protein